EKITGASEPYSAFASVTHEHLLGHIQCEGYGDILSGLGSDEIFGGYIKYLNFYTSMRLHQSANDGVDGLEQLLWQPALINEKVFAGVPRFFHAGALKNQLKAPFNQWDLSAPLHTFYGQSRELKSDAHLFELMIAHECQHRIPELLLGGFEAIGRGANVQTTYPFLDKNVVQLAIGLGATERFELRDNRWDNKIVMRDIARTRLPEEVCSRLRQAYVPPLLLWLAYPPFFDTIWSVIEHSELQSEGLFEGDMLAEMKDKVRHIVDKGDIRVPMAPVDEMWVIFTLSAWYDRWVTR
ncbi:MAG: asparagine synthase (glutamine-hydrolyzing), partial [Phenylobacterium sp.]